MITVLNLLQKLNKFRLTPVGKQIRPFFFFCGEIYRRTILRVFPRITFKKFISEYGPFRLNGKFLFSDFEHWAQGHNSGFNELIEASRDARCVLDVGAHIGLATLPLASVIAEGGVVFAFEPSNANQRYLEMHISANQLNNVVVVRSLVGDQALSNVEFFDNRDASGMNSIANIGGDVEKKFIEMITLDRFVKDHSLRPEVIKIDVEGAELKVLKGADKLLRAYNPVIFLSAHPRQLDDLGDSVEELEEYIIDLGYGIFDVTGSRRIEGCLEFGEYKLLRTQIC